MRLWKLNLIIYHSVPFRLQPTLSIQTAPWQIIGVDINIHIPKGFDTLHIKFRNVLLYLLLEVSIYMIIYF